MRNVAWLLVFLAAAALGQAGPMKGSFATRHKVPAGSPGALEIKEPFKGGQRACVIVRGDHNPVVDLGIEVRDPDGNVAAKHEGNGDYAAVIWYPPRDGLYTIYILNPSTTYNDCYISVK